VETGITLAAAEGVKRLYCWLGTGNARAIGFATSLGFRVTSHRRAANRGPAAGDTEMALVLPLEE
jgi:L-amino acid N-acyltransferase YncA